MSSTTPPGGGDDGEQGRGSGSGAPVTVQQMKRYVQERLGGYRSSLGHYLGGGLSGVARRLDGRVMRSADTVAEKLNDVARDASGECSFDATPVSETGKINTYIARERLELLNALRRFDAERYSQLAQFSERLARVDSGDDDDDDYSEEDLRGGDDDVRDSKNLLVSRFFSRWGKRGDM